MKVNYQYNSPSMCVQQQDKTTLSLSPDMSRDENVSFTGTLKHPLIFRDAMLMLREIVISDGSQKKKERIEFYDWLGQEIERRIQKHKEYLPHVREDLKNQIKIQVNEQIAIDSEINRLHILKIDIQKELDKKDVWNDFHNLERKFWKFIKQRDYNLWFVLDPVITVHPDQVSFEAFSVDESIYGCMSIDMTEFELKGIPKLGTTNIDFSFKLAQEMMRFRTYTNVELSINPDGFSVDTGVTPNHIEKKIDLPETWIKGFNQVSSAAKLDGISLRLSSIDMYDICAFLRRHKENKSPRYMKWVLEKDQPVRIVFEPFGTTLTLRAIYKGEKNREEKIWGRRRWLILEKLLPIANQFEVKLLGFGMPQFIIADMGKIKMTVGFSSWTSNDWVKGTAFNIMSGFIGEGNYTDVYSLLKENRYLTLPDLFDAFKKVTKTEVTAGIGSLLKRGEGYFDPINNTVRFRKLCNVPLNKELYESSQLEIDVKNLVDLSMDHFTIKMTENKEYVFKNSYSSNDNNHKKSYQTEITIDEDGQINKLSCDCRTFKQGSKNISSPCSHILALYVVSAKFTKIALEPDKEYKINDYLEMLL